MPTESVPTGGSFAQKSSVSSYAKAGSCCIKSMPATAVCSMDLFSDWWRCLSGRQEIVLMIHSMRERYGIRAKLFGIICSKLSLVMLFARGRR